MKYFQFNFQELKILQILKNESNLEKLSNTLYLSRPALSLKVQKLESKIGSSILNRYKKQVGLNKTGELTLEYTDKILHLFKEANYSIIYFKRLRKISLTVGSNELVGRSLIRKLLQLFCKYYSYTYFTLVLESTHFIAWEVFKGNVDLGIITGKEIPIELYDLLYTEDYFKENIVLILPKSYKLEDLNNITLKDLYNFDFIGLLANIIDRQILEKVLLSYGIDYSKLKIKFELNSVEAIKRSVQAGLGVSFLSIFAVRDELFLQRIQTVVVNKININQKLVIVIGEESYTPLLGKFYRHCLLIINIRPYLSFVSLLK
uniref:putative RuBisCO transcriptional regulator n=1 Tax=Analipus japonicus TaxID=31333 RepID=UPI002E775F5A|nr:putative RuBisCO transcriptional regulator [Analipus japonicus]WAM61908.1 putative RuBisCO transcriptional regulator [Analipus japonicus]